MPRELLYTSAPRGLLPGRSGYCTVAATAGLSTTVIEQLERLSGYLSIPENKSAADHVKAFSHWRVPFQGKTHSVLSRVTSAGTDYTGRSRKEIYYVVLEPAEYPAAGPAWLVAQPLAMDGPVASGQSSPTDPHWIRGTKPIPSGDCEPKPCAFWETVAGDAGWAGILAERLMSPATKVAYLLCPRDASPLGLIGEAMLLLPPSFRWKVSFNTCFSAMPNDLSCALRCITPDTVAKFIASMRRTESFILDLTVTPQRAPNTPASEAARGGRLIAPLSIAESGGEMIDQRSRG